MKAWLRNHKFLSILIACLMIVAFVGIAAVASAPPSVKPGSQKVSGTFVNTPAIISYIIDTALDPSHAVWYQNQDSSFAGSFVGTWHSQWIVYLDPSTRHFTAVGTGDFLGYVVDKKGNHVTGTFTFQVTGYGYWNNDYTMLYFHNDWAIVDGSGGLATITGSGTFDHNFAAITDPADYSGTISLGK
jgi:hypothetical protein